MGMNCVYKGQKMILFYIKNSYILRPKLPKTPIFLAKIILYSSYILGKTWLTACTGCEGMQVHILNLPVLLYRVRVGAGAYSQPAGFIAQGARGCRCIFSTPWFYCTGCKGCRCIFSTRRFYCTGCEGMQVHILNPLVLLYRVRGGAGGYSQPASFIVQGARECRCIFSTCQFYCTGCEGVQVHILNLPVLLYRVRGRAGAYSQPASFIVQGARGCMCIFSTPWFYCTGCEGVQVHILNPPFLLYRVRGGAGAYCKHPRSLSLSHNAGLSGCRGGRWCLG